MNRLLFRRGLAYCTFVALLLAAPHGSSAQEASPEPAAQTDAQAPEAQAVVDAAPVEPSPPDGGTGVVEVGAGDGAPTVVEDSGWESGGGIRMNFQGVPLDTVLDYLSREAGFVIVREVQVEGRVDVQSQQPLSREEVVDLLNTVLNAKGFAAIRSGRTLTIVRREDAAKRNIPVKLGSDPEGIPQNDEMVTQIIPVRYANATKLVENLQALMAPYAVISPNESSNAIVLTDTQANVRRMVEIVRALDTSISNISTVKVFVLNFADAKETAQLVTSVFETPSEQANQAPPFFRRGGGFPFGPGGGQEEETAGDSPARKAVSRVVAVAESRTNAVVVSAPEDLMPTISTLIEEIDTASDSDTEVRVFPLQHAAAEDMAELIQNVFAADAASNRAQTGPRFAGPGEFFRRAFGGGPGGPGMMGGMGQGGAGSSQSSLGTVTAAADARTNSVIVSAPAQLLVQIEGMVAELDKNPARTKQVFVYSLKNADAETVASIVEGMFDQTGSGTRSGAAAGRRTNTNSRNTGTNRNANRQDTGSSGMGGFGQGMAGNR